VSKVAGFHRDRHWLLCFVVNGEGRFGLSHDEALVGTVALLVAGLSIFFAVGPWSMPYELRTIAGVEAKFGKQAARGVWLFIAILSGVSSIAILTDVRPSYATPTAKAYQLK